LDDHYRPAATLRSIRSLSATMAMISAFIGFNFEMLSGWPTA
jgi:hypothetical protein